MHIIKTLTISLPLANYLESFKSKLGIKFHFTLNLSSNKYLENYMQVAHTNMWNFPHKMFITVA
jgi:hypothetical protein